ncbi:hypothetical protein [Mycoplasma procyoni]|uniref:hypothetical protein n=1 Tax=Mycoplasma procyoni TaxID=568784 RepID=UPI00197B6680|nr:hypothetical protein [Mycoplasma procyoni]MBN3534861.1 hypothetical protein [Mycoplasma procyoni]
MKKIKWSILMATAITIPTIFSCQKSEEKIDFDKEKDSQYNGTFTKPTVPTDPNVDIFNLKLSDQNEIFQEPIVTVLKGEKLYKEDFPETIKVVNSSNVVTEQKVVWESDRFKKTLWDETFEVEGHLESNPQQKVKAKVYVDQNDKSVSYSSSVPLAFNQAQGNSMIDFKKSSTDGGRNIWFILTPDTSQTYKWDNSRKHNQEQQPYLTFNWNEEKTISQIKIWWWTGGPGGKKLPEKMKFFSSKDGKTWIPVTRLEKDSAADFGGEDIKMSSQANVTEPTEFNFDTIKTHFFKFEWEPAKTETGGNSSIGITAFRFFAKSPEYLEVAEKSSISHLNSISINDKEIEGFEANKTDYNIQLDDLNQEPKITYDNIKTRMNIQLKQVFSQKDENKNVLKRVYKILVTAQNGDTKVYTLNVSKK